MTRNGKIARLPDAVRRELNQRLRNGEKGRLLIAWLNGLPEVQAVLAAEFNGQPIEEYNLSRWKSGGYEAWLAEQNTLEAAAGMFEDSPDLQAAGAAGLQGRMALLLTAKMAVELQRLDRLPDGPKKFDMAHRLLEQFYELRRDELQSERLRLEWEKLRLRHDIPANSAERLPR